MQFSTQCHRIELMRVTLFFVLHLIYLISDLYTQLTSQVLVLKIIKHIHKNCCNYRGIHAPSLQNKLYLPFRSISSC